MAKKQKQLPDLSSHDPLVPIDLTSIGGNGDPCFGKAYDLSTKECKLCGDSELCAYRMSQLLNKTRKELEEKNVFKSLKSYWKSDISKNLKEGKNVLIVTDEDTIRILIKYLLDMSDRDIQNVYIPIDNTFYFEVDKNLEVIRAEFPIPPKFPERIDEF